MSRKNKIDLDKQLSEFYSTLDYKPISANAISIYLILLQIDCKTDWLTEFRVANTILMSKIKGLSISSLQRARNELINNQYILYKKGVNQNDASTYSIIKLYFEQANEQPNEQPNAQADELPAEHIITKLNLFFNYIYNNASANEIGLLEKDKPALINIFKKLELYVESIDVYDYFTEENLLDEKIKLWSIKEIYLSPYKVYLNNLKKDIFKFRYLKAKKYITSKSDYKLQELISYFVVCLQDELKKGSGKNVK